MSSSTACCQSNCRRKKAESQEAKHEARDYGGSDSDDHADYLAQRDVQDLHDLAQRDYLEMLGFKREAEDNMEERNLESPEKREETHAMVDRDYLSIFGIGKRAFDGLLEDKLEMVDRDYSAKDSKHKTGRKVAERDYGGEGEAASDYMV